MQFSIPDTIELKKVYKKELNRCYKIIGGGILLCTIFLLIPAEYLPRKARINRTEVSGNILESLGIVGGSIFIAVILLLTVLIGYFGIGIPKFKKDLLEKEKIIAKVKVKEIEAFSTKDIKELREVGTNLTHSIHFEKNDYKLKKYPFFILENPELMEAKEIILELAKYSRHEFNREIIK